MVNPTITVSETVSVARPPEEVWDYTQDYSRRREWDDGVREVELLGTHPRRVRLRFRRAGSATLEYRLDRRPERTSLQLIDISSLWIADGGGSWEYVAEEAGTAWTQTNSIVLRFPRLGALARPLVRRMLRAGIRRSMERAKVILEAGPGA